LFNLHALVTDLATAFFQKQHPNRGV